MKKTLTAIAMTLALPLAANAALTKYHGDWVYNNGEDPLTGAKNSMAMTLSTTGKGRYGQPVKLMLICPSGYLVAAFDWESYLGDADDVLFKIDDEPAESRSVMTSQSTSYIMDGEQLANRLVNADSFIARTDTYSRGSITAIFSMKGSAAAINRVIKDCK